MSETHKQTHKVTYRGTYFSAGSRDTCPYTITLEVPHETVKNANILEWFRKQLKDTKSEEFKAFTKEHADFDTICTHAIENLAELEEIKRELNA